MQRCQDWISLLRVHRRMSISSGLDRILRRVVMCIDCIGRLFSLCDRRDDKVGEDTLLIQHVPLDDGANIIEHGDVVVRVKRSFKDSVRTTCDSDIYRSSISRYFYLRWDVASEDVVRRSVIDLLRSCSSVRRIPDSFEPGGSGRWSIPLKKEKPSSCVGRKTKAYRKGGLGSVSRHRKST